MNEKRRRFASSEEVLARTVVAWLIDHHWEVFQEVAMDCGVADIVARQGPLLWVIEAKTSLGLSVIEQAHRWAGLASYRSVAVPWTRARFGLDLCRMFGIGVLFVSENEEWSGYNTPVREYVRPALTRRIGTTIAKSLYETQKTWAPAGNANGSRWTPFAQTCRNVAEAVRQRPGLSVKDLIASVETHYATPASARSCVLKWAEAGYIDGVQVRREGRRIGLFPIATEERSVDRL